MDRELLNVGIKIRNRGGVLLLMILLWMCGSCNKKSKSSQGTLVEPIFELEVYFFDLPQIESNDPTYTSLVYVANHKTKTLSGPFRGSSFPNSHPSDPSRTVYNTIVDKEHIFNNRTGHKGTTVKGLNIVDRVGRKKWEGRNNEGWDPSANLLTMFNVNVHSGVSNKGNYNSRGSHGCLTIFPPDVEQFFNSIGYPNPTATIGDVEGGLYLFRESKEVTDMLINALQGERVNNGNDDLNQGEVLLSEARIRMRNKLMAPAQDIADPMGEELKKLARMSQKSNYDTLEIKRFLEIDPEKYKNNVEFSQLYNETLFRMMELETNKFVRTTINTKDKSRQNLNRQINTPVNDRLKTRVVKEKLQKEVQMQWQNSDQSLEANDEQKITKEYEKFKAVNRVFDGKNEQLREPQRLIEIRRRDSIQRHLNLRSPLPAQPILEGRALDSIR